MVILLTGGRIRIGFQVGLKCLRNGSTLIVTSRFPKDTARRYAQEKDFNAWKHRLIIYGLDFRDINGLEKVRNGKCVHSLYIFISLYILC